jgi:pSer/pThr/pTyr-binding forkhead associated (FHA) protein
MAKKNAPDPALATSLDPNLSLPRLKEGLVPGDTGIFLRVEDGRDTGLTRALSSGGSYVIGREGADVALDDPKVSRKHAELSLLGPGAYLVRDLASTNGTFVNGKRVTDRCKLGADDVVRVGDTVLRVSIIEQSIPVS